MQTAQANKKVKMVRVNISDRTQLFKSYMGFLKQGGVFITTADSFDMGEEVLLLLNVMDHPNQFPLHTNVVWINSASGNVAQPQGVGLMFSEDDLGKQAKSIIEKNLAGVLDNPLATYTM